MKVEGRCHCGKITYSAEVDESAVSVCHCTDCQRLSGSPYRASVAAKRADFELHSGEPKTYVKTSEDGTQRVQTFCGDCGTPIYATGLDESSPLNLRVGALNERAALAPRRQIWMRSALPWVKTLERVAGIEKD
jgi:hypothetical protein